MHATPNHNAALSTFRLRRAMALALLPFLLAFSFGRPAPPALASPSAESAQAQPASATQVALPYTYAVASSVSSYDIMLAEGAPRGRRIARIKVDSVFFSDVTARLSADRANAAFRVTGDRLGGSALYSFDIAGGNHLLVAKTKSVAEGIGTYLWSPAGNTLAFVRSSPALDPADVDSAYGRIYIYSVGFEAVPLLASNGNDRLLAFSPDGNGIFAARRDGADASALEHLVYLPLHGLHPRVLLRSRPDLSYTRFTVWSRPGHSPKIVAVAEGSFSPSVAEPSAATQGTSAAQQRLEIASAPGHHKVSTAGKLVRPNELGLVVADPAGTWPALLRQDAEAYRHISWAYDGGVILLGGTRTGTSWSLKMDGDRQPLGASLLGMNAVGWSEDGSTVVLSDLPSSRLVTLDTRGGSVLGTQWVGGGLKPGPAVMRLAVPYIHQVNDTATSGDGNWACGPTSIAMSLAYYGKLQPWTSYLRQISPPSPGTEAGTPAPPEQTDPQRKVTGVDYAPYITQEYTSNGRTYSALARDPRGRLLAGLYGTISPTGLASWPAMLSVLESHGLSSRYVGATWDGIVGALKRGHPVLVGNMLTPQGHILVAIGYTNDGNLIVHDPYGNKFAPGYGGNNGEAIVYPWKRLTARRALEVIGVYPPPTATPLPSTATPTATETPIPPSATPTDTAVPPTFTPLPTDTPLPMPTFVELPTLMPIAPPLEEPTAAPEALPPTEEASPAALP